MIDTSNDKYFDHDGLLPFQIEFIKEFLNSNEKNFWQLTSSVGLDKHNLIINIILHIISENQNKRILIITPPALTKHWEYSISSSLKNEKSSYSTLIIDRKTFLELESNVDVNARPWPTATISIMSLYLAKRDDMIPEICNEFWDLIVFDESHNLYGKKGKDLLEKINEKKRFQYGLLLTPIAQTFDILEGLVTKTVGKDIRDWNGNPVFQQINDVMNIDYYQRSEEEIQFFKDLQVVTSNITKRLNNKKLQSEIILRAASSSIYSLEMTLRILHNKTKELSNKLVHKKFLKLDELIDFKKYFDFIGDVSLIEQATDTININFEIFVDLFEQIESLLNKIDELPIDSKLIALISRIENFLKIKENSHICVLSSFLNTVEYLKENLGEFGKPIWAITGDINMEDSYKIIESFKGEGGILLITDASLKGLTFEFVQEVVNYDLPINKNKFELRWGRFARFGRKSELNMIALVDQENAFDWETNILENLKTLYL